MRLTTWNVNGIRNPFSYQPWNSARTFPAMFDILGSDIVVMQELKIQRKDLRDDMVMFDGWDCYFSLPKHKKGYSGVGIYTRNATCAPIRAEEGLLGVIPSPSGVPYCELPEAESIGGYPSVIQVADLAVDPAALDAEGRCLVLEFPAFVLLGVYSPANSNGLRDDFRHSFIRALDFRIRNLIRAGKRVVLVGDLNVSRDELDTASAAEDVRKAAISHEEYISAPNRRIFNQLLIGGEIFGERDDGRENGVMWDTTRAFHPGRNGMYTHWEQKINARPGNFGSRIDFVLVCDSMRQWVKDANIQEGLLGSDHCPVFADFHETICVSGRDTRLIDVMNPSGVFENGIRIQEWKVQNVPAFSAKRLPEFDKRRSIISMFTTPTVKKSSSSSLDDSSVSQSTPPSGLAASSEVKDNEPRTGETSSSKSIYLASEAHLSPPKRKIATAVKEKPTKRLKSDSQTPTLKGQQSLKGFFQKRELIAESDSVDGCLTARESPGNNTDMPMAPLLPTNVVLLPEQTLDKPSGTDSPPKPDIVGGIQLADCPPTPPNMPSPSDSAGFSPSQFSEKLAAVEQNQKSWNSLFSRPVAPLCEGHSEPCQTMLTKKKGSNQGRSFWMCARPLGPSGSKERGSQWRCPTFIWCSDWGVKKENGRDDGER